MDITPIRGANTTRDPVLADTVLDLVNISSSFDEGFTVEPFSLPEIENMFRFAPSSVMGMPTAFIGPAEASLFMSHPSEDRARGCIDTRGTSLESELMDLMNDIPDTSPTTMVDTSDDEMNTFPEANFANVQRNAFGGPTQKVCPMHRRQREARHDINPPRVPSQTSAFTAYAAPRQRTADPSPRPIQQAHYLPMPVSFYPNTWNNIRYGPLNDNTQTPASNNTSTQNGRGLLPGLY